jgi:hypothetical protein
MTSAIEILKASPKYSLFQIRKKKAPDNSVTIAGINLPVFVTLA